MVRDSSKYLEQYRLHRLDPRKRFTVGELRDLARDDPFWAVDFYVTGIEEGRLEPYGHVCDTVVNIDHHAPVPEMESFVTSTTLAARWVDSYGVLPHGSNIALNHVDCDTALALAVLTGWIEFSPAVDRAVTAADHTGEEDRIADAIQGAGRHCSIEDAFTLLDLVLAQQWSAPSVKRALEKRQADRAMAKSMMQRGVVHQDGGVVVVESFSELDPLFLLPEFLSAAVVGVLYPTGEDSHKYLRLRLGRGAPQGFNLHTLMAGTSFVADFHGRWNAGSNRRGKGSEIDGTRLVQCLKNRVKETYDQNL